MNKERDLAYVCSPLNAPTAEEIRENMIRAKNYAECVAKVIGCRAIAPHSFLPEYLDDNNPVEREVGMKFCYSVLEICKAVVVCGDRISRGMEQEISRAKELGILVYKLIESETGHSLQEI